MALFSRRDDPNWLDRALDISPGERRLLVLAFLCATIAFTGYSILRPIRETMGVTADVSRRPLILWTVVIVLLIIQPIYGWALSRMPLKTVLPAIYMALAVMLVGFYAWARLDEDRFYLASTYFVWVTVVNLFLVSLFWSLMADVFDSDQAARLFGAIASGFSFGGLLGSGLTAILVHVVGTISLILVAATLWVASASLLRMMASLGDNDHRTPHTDRIAEALKFKGIWSAFVSIYRSRYLYCIALFVFMSTASSFVVYAEQQRLVKSSIVGADAQTAFFAQMDFWAQLLSLAVQIFIFRRALNWLGLPGIVCIVPCVAALISCAMLFYSSLGLIATAMLFRRVSEYGLVKPCRDLLFTLVPLDDKYKAKSVIDTLWHRVGDSASLSVYNYLMLGVGLTISNMFMPGMIGLVICLAWIGVSIALSKSYLNIKSGRLEA